MPQTRLLSEDEAMSLRKDHLRDTGAGTAIAKAWKAPASWKKEDRSARFVMTTQQVDRYGDIVVTDGIRLDDFLRNPVGLLFHNSRSWPVAKWENIEKMSKGRPPRMEGDFVLLPADGPGEIGQRVAETEFMIANGGVRATSIGFVPNWKAVEYVTDEDGKPTYGLKFLESELIECSVCSVPANAGALVKSADGDPTLARELIEDILDNWERSPEGLLLSRKDFEEQYQIVRRAAPTAPKAPPTTDWMPAPAVERDLTRVPMDKMRELQTIAREQGKPAADAALDEFLKSLPAEGADGNQTPPADPPAPPITPPPGPESDQEADTDTDGDGEDEDGETKTAKAIAIKLDLDTTEAMQKASGMSVLLDEIAAKFTKIFGRSAPVEERREPVFDPPPAADEETVQAVRARAAAAAERAAKHLP